MHFLAQCSLTGAFSQYYIPKFTLNNIVCLFLWWVFSFKAYTVFTNNQCTSSCLLFRLFNILVSSKVIRLNDCRNYVNSSHSLFLIFHLRHHLVRVVCFLSQSFKHWSKYHICWNNMKIMNGLIRYGLIPCLCIITMNVYNQGYVVSVKWVLEHPYKVSAKNLCLELI